MVCYVYDCNYVRVIPMKSRSTSEWVKAYDTIHQELTVKGFKPKLQTLDNKASAALKTFFTANDMEYQLVPPHCHIRNAAESAIQTFKEHFEAGLSSVDPPFHCTCETDSYRRRKSHRISCGPRDSTHNYPPPLTFMASWITTKQLLRRQDAK
jgi:hypothetical protein